MYRILKADKDCYIHNKVVDGIRTIDSNTGQAKTLDLWYLYNESSISSESGSIEELSRLLIHFNLDPLRALTGSILDFSTSSFRAILKLSDVYGGQTTPSNFGVSVFALNRQFDEGNGRDIASYRDLDSCNFITASVSNGSPILWAISGANHPTQDYISSTHASQIFTLGTEDLQIDISSIISGTLAGIYPDYGLRISFSGSHESDQRTKFVKRFGARHTNNPSIRPQLIVKYEDHKQDDTGAFFFGLTGSLFLNNIHNGQLANIPGVIGTSSFILEIVSGTNSNPYLSGTHILSGNVSGSATHRILSGTLINLSGTLYRKYVTGSQHRIGNNFVTGVYRATFAIDASETGSLLTEVRNANSATFKVIWQNFAGTNAYITGTLVVNEPPRLSALRPEINIIRIVNNVGQYKTDDVPTFRVYAQRNIPQSFSVKKTPMFRKSEILKNMYYQIVDANSKKIVVPFDTVYTKVSTDSDGMFFKVHMEDLSPGLTYGIELRFEEQGSTITYDVNRLGSVFTIQ